MKKRKNPIKFLTTEQSILKASGIMSCEGRSKLEEKAKEIAIKEFKEDMKKEFNNENKDKEYNNGDGLN